jgi:F-type H+-transporting ATPase subunit b
MDATLQALGGILLRSIPTIVLVIFLHFYLKRMFFQPLDKLLHERREATIGAQEAAQAALATARGKQAQYEEALRQTRAALFRDYEERRKALLDDQTRRLAEARNAARKAVAQAKEDLAKDAAGAKQELTAASQSLADSITEGILAGRAA